VGLNRIALSGRIRIDDNIPRAMPSATMVQAVGLSYITRAFALAMIWEAPPLVANQALKGPTIIAEGSALGWESHHEFAL
jgi:hypothetical protein